MTNRIMSGVWRNRVAVAAWVVLIGSWEAASYLVPRSLIRGSEIVPSWQLIFTQSLRGTAGSWPFDFIVKGPLLGGGETYPAAFLGLAYNSAVTLERLLLGLLAGALLGVFCGLAVSYSVWVRRLAWTPFNWLRMAPLLAAIPLFQFWFGATTEGTTVFIGLGVWVVLVVATLNAVRNVPDVYIEYARTLGASRLRTYLRVVVPATLPELRTALLLSAGMSWSLAIGAEYIGLQNGLGSVLETAESFANTGRMMIVAILIGFYALVTFAILFALSRRLVRWMPGADDGTQVEGAGVVGMSGISGEEVHL
jgi:sulfonate transport system permease protein